MTAKSLGLLTRDWRRTRLRDEKRRASRHRSFGASRVVLTPQDAQGLSVAGQPESKERATRGFDIKMQRATDTGNRDAPDARMLRQLAFVSSRCIQTPRHYTKTVDEGTRRRAELAEGPLDEAEHSKRL